MARATIRDLRTRFPYLKALIAKDGEVVVTDRGRPAFVLKAYAPPPERKASPVDYFARLKRYQPQPLSKKASRALDEADRDER